MLSMSDTLLFKVGKAAVKICSPRSYWDSDSHLRIGLIAKPSSMGKILCKQYIQHEKVVILDRNQIIVYVQIYFLSKRNNKILIFLSSVDV